MSIIVAVKKNNKIAIGSDSQFNTGSLKKSSEYVVNSEKIFNVGSSFIGLTGWSATSLAAEHLFEKHKGKLNFDNRISIFETLLKMHELLKDEYYFKTKEDDDEQPVESNQIFGLIINPNGIFGISSYREVIEYRKFWAIGSGRSIALGALYACYNTYNQAEKIADTGIKAACEFNDACGLPAKIFEVDLNKTV